MKAVIYVVICLSFCTHLIQCSCLSYGHSCWGGHGKRSSGAIANHRGEMGSQPQPDRWALFRSMQNDNNREERNLQMSQDDSMDYLDKGTADELMNKRNIPMFIVNPSMRESERPRPGLKYLLRKRKFFASDPVPVPTADPDTEFGTTPYSVQSDDVHVPKNNRFYNF